MFLTLMLSWLAHIYVITYSYHMMLLFLYLYRDVIDTTGKLTYLGSVFVYSDGLQVNL